MSDKVLNIINKQRGIKFSEKEMKKTNQEFQREIDRRIADMLHKIEFTDISEKNGMKMCMKLQSFLKKRRAIKPGGKLYVPRTETGNYIVEGRVLDKKKEE